MHYILSASLFNTLFSFEQLVQENSLELLFRVIVNKRQSRTQQETSKWKLDIYSNCHTRIHEPLKSETTSNGIHSRILKLFFLLSVADKIILQKDLPIAAHDVFILRSGEGISKVWRSSGAGFHLSRFFTSFLSLANSFCFSFTW